jgi:hypothetical protein
MKGIIEVVLLVGFIGIELLLNIGGWETEEKNVL